MTHPFEKPKLQPPAPCWIVRELQGEDAVEIVFVGLCNRLELDAHVERLARWPWHLDEDGSVTVLADARAEIIGIRIERSSQDTEVILGQVQSLFDAAIVCYGCRAHTWRRIANGGRP